MEITVSEKEGIVIFRLSGRIMTPGVKEFSDAVEEALGTRASPLKLVFDFKEVSRMDSSGLGALMKIYSQIQPSGGEVAVINVNKHIKDLIVMARLITVFKNFESENDAVAALRQDP